MPIAIAVPTTPPIAEQPIPPANSSSPQPEPVEKPVAAPTARTKVVAPSKLTARSEAAGLDSAPAGRHTGSSDDTAGAAPTATPTPPPPPIDPFVQAVQQDIREQQELHK
jgi:hypothetical protein